MASLSKMYVIKHLFDDLLYSFELQNKTNVVKLHRATAFLAHSSKQKLDDQYDVIFVDSIT